MKNLRLKLIACKVFYREVSLLSVECPHFIDATFIRQGLHDTPKLLQETLQQTIDRIDAGEDIGTTDTKYKRDFDAILLGYGLCSNGVAGLSSKRYPLVVPRVDDCIALFLGSRKKYQKVFDENPGTFWYNASWIESSYTPSKESYEAMYAYYCEEYGEDNAQYLVEASLIANYSTVGYIEWDTMPDLGHKAFAKEAARYLGWQYREFTGSQGFLKDFLHGNWDDERFLYVPPNEQITPVYDGRLIACTEGS
ncbi:MAG: DUF1638 domain-containing protein [Christensenellales bacterium]|jgi:hypothetical protein